MQRFQQRLQSVIDCMGNDAVSLYVGYSGRGMYGAQCIGITGSFEDCMSVIGEVIKDAREEDSFDELVSTLLGFKQDSMGRDVILYWPELEAIEEDFEDDGQPDEAQEWHDFDPDC